MKLFTYIFADESIHELPSLTSNELYELKEKHGDLVFNGFMDQVGSQSLLRANSHSRGDGFKPGFHPALGMEIRSNEQYQRVLKEKGMVEVGNERQRDTVKKKTNFTEEVIKDAVAAGAEISGNEAAKLLGEI
jgi:hypothetical protein